MQPLTFDNVSYLAGGKRVFLISGEVQYFRVPHQHWRDRLEKLKASGELCRHVHPLDVPRAGGRPLRFPVAAV